MSLRALRVVLAASSVSLALPPAARAAEPAPLVHPIFAHLPDAPENDTARERFTAAATRYKLRPVEVVDVQAPPEPRAPTEARMGILNAQKLAFGEALHDLDAAAAEVTTSGGAGLDATALSDLYLYRAMATARADWNAQANAAPTDARGKAFDDYLRAATIAPTRALNPRELPPQVVADLAPARHAGGQGAGRRAGLPGRRPPDADRRRRDVSRSRAGRARGARRADRLRPLGHGGAVRSAGARNRGPRARGADPRRRDRRRARPADGRPLRARRHAQRRPGRAAADRPPRHHDRRPARRRRDASYRCGSRGRAGGAAGATAPPDPAAQQGPIRRRSGRLGARPLAAPDRDRRGGGDRHRHERDRLQRSVNRNPRRVPHLPR